jgi:hypothetical protein
MLHSLNLLIFVAGATLLAVLARYRESTTSLTGCRA